MAPVPTLFAELPEFEGIDPVGTELTFSGGSGRRTRAMRIGERIALVVEVAVTGVNHKETKGGIVRVHQLRVEDAYELGGDRAPDLLEQLHDEHESWLDEMRGRQKLPFDGEDGGDDPDAQEAAAGAGPEARADERDERLGEGDGFDALDPDPDAAPLAEVECPTCGGAGKIGRGRNRKDCPACLGKGTIIGTPAPEE